MDTLLEEAKEIIEGLFQLSHDFSAMDTLIVTIKIHGKSIKIVSIEPRLFSHGYFLDAETQKWSKPRFN
jgi:hypothetical protein